MKFPQNGAGISPLLSLKDLWEHLYRCRDFELNNLWQRSLFLWTLLGVVLTGYGYFLQKYDFAFMNLRSTQQLIAAVLSFLIMLLGALFYWMGKASKYWTEVYEAKINFIENYCLSHCIPQPLRHAEYKIPDSKHFLGCKHYSTSKINVLIGAIVGIVGCVCYLVHGYGLICYLSAIIDDCRFCLRVAFFSILCIFTIVLLYLIDCKCKPGSDKP
ncbi:MAG: hypothetical protein IKR13_03515 [Victivallales bacterium]|nr:hypothetical protein [Victivallales bacterium]